jgi:hypothetical protein
VGTISPAQAVSVTNTGGATATIAGISIGSGFAQTNNCGSGLVAHGACSISVTFSPTGAGPQTASMTLTDNATNSPQVVTLSGKGNNGKGKGH